MELHNRGEPRGGELRGKVRISSVFLSLPFNAPCLIVLANTLVETLLMLSVSLLLTDSVTAFSPSQSPSLWPYPA